MCDGGSGTIERTYPPPGKASDGGGQESCKGSGHFPDYGQQISGGSWKSEHMMCSSYVLLALVVYGFSNLCGLPQ